MSHNWNVSEFVKVGGTESLEAHFMANLHKGGCRSYEQASNGILQDGEWLDEVFGGR